MNPKLYQYFEVKNVNTDTEIVKVSVVSENLNTFSQKSVVSENLNTFSQKSIELHTLKSSGVYSNREKEMLSLYGLDTKLLMQQKLYDILLDEIDKNLLKTIISNSKNFEINLNVIDLISIWWKKFVKFLNKLFKFKTQEKYLFKDFTEFLNTSGVNEYVLLLNAKTYCYLNDSINLDEILIKFNLQTIIHHLIDDNIILKVKKTDIISFIEPVNESNFSMILCGDNETKIGAMIRCGFYVNPSSSIYNIIVI